MSADRLALPRLLLIADGFASGRKVRDVGAVWMAAEAAVREGPPCLVMLRDHAASDHEFEVAARMLTMQLRGHVRSPRTLAAGSREAALYAAQRQRSDAARVQIVVNARGEVAWEERAGLHTGARGPVLAEVAGRFSPVGYSAHTPEEAGRAAREGADYVTFSPIFPTSSKPGHPGAGLDALAEAAKAASPVPVYALGGVTPGRVRACLDAGAHGVAVLSGILDAPDPAAAALAYHKAIAAHA